MPKFDWVMRCNEFVSGSDIAGKERAHFFNNILHER
jgi:hypothetical protein